MQVTCGKWRVTGQKLLTESLQKQQKRLAEHIKDQQGALEKRQQAISQLTFNTSNGSRLNAVAVGLGPT